MIIVEHQIIKYWNSSTSNSAASNSSSLNSATWNSATLKATTLSSVESLIKKELLWKLNIIVAAIICCFATSQQSAQYVAQLTINCDKKAKNKCCTLVVTK